VGTQDGYGFTCSRCSHKRLMALGVDSGGSIAAPRTSAVGASRPTGPSRPNDGFRRPEWTFGVGTKRQIWTIRFGAAFKGIRDNL
jgi:hypothetical protein